MSSISKCPKCGYSSDIAFEECPQCGVIIEKFMKIKHSKEKQKRIEELEKKLHKIEKIYTSSNQSNFRKKLNRYVDYNSATKFIFAFAVLFTLSLIITGIFNETKTSTGYDYIYKCNGYLKEMERANHAYVYGGGTKAEFEKARRRWQECVLRNK